jgi:hypothetical protein
MIADLHGGDDVSKEESLVCHLSHYPKTTQCEDTQADEANKALHHVRQAPDLHDRSTYP